MHCSGVLPCKHSGCRTMPAAQRDSLHSPWLLATRCLKKSRTRASSVAALARARDVPEPDVERPRGIFETCPPSAETVTILDARDALETCGELTGRGRESCFAQFGCSSDRVTTYFSAVEAMERAFEREEQGDDDEYVPDKGNGELPNPLGFVWRS